MKIRISGIDYNIVYKKQRLDDNGALGYFHYDTQEFGIDVNRPPDIQKDVLIHEIVEAGNHILDLELEHDDITKWGHFWSQVINDNPHLFTNKFKGVK